MRTPTRRLVILISSMIVSACGSSSTDVISGSAPGVRKAPQEDRGTPITAEAECRGEADNINFTDDSDAVASFQKEEVALDEPGHSKHGKAFDVGPRQEAYLLTGVGESHFTADSCDPKVQPYMDQAMGLTHGFATYEAERSFRQAAKIDPKCALAYVGMALANDMFESGLKSRACKFTHIAESLKKGTTKREQLYIDVLSTRFDKSVPHREDRKRNTIGKLRLLTKKFPKDLEAKALYVVMKWEYLNLEDSDQEELSKVIDSVLAVQPNHPIHHFRIHLFDYYKRETALRALASAQLSGPSSPNVAHQWHMASHIFADLDMLSEGAWNTEASVRTDNRVLTRRNPANGREYQTMPYEVHNYRHHSDYFAQFLFSSGQGTKAAEYMMSLRNIPNALPVSGKKYFVGLSDYGIDQALLFARVFELWTLLEFADRPDVLLTNNIEIHAKRTLFKVKAAALGALTLDQGRAAVEEFEKRMASSKLNETATSDYADLLKTLNLMLKMSASSDPEQNKNDFEEMVDLDFVRPVELPSLALKLGLPKRALKAAKSYVDYMTLDDIRDQHIRRVTLANAQYIRSLIASGQEKEAKEQFKKYEKYFSNADVNSPLFDFLQNKNVVTKPLPPASLPTASDKYALDQMGPLTWQPIQAPTDTALKDMTKSGKPTLVIFYLSLGCIACSEQMTLLGESIEALHNLGYRTILVSTNEDDAARPGFAKLTSKDGKSSWVEFHGDPKGEIFKAFGAYDDFEEKPLHGIFFINSKGKMLIQDVSYTAQLNLDAVHKEAKRLLLVHGN